MALAMVDKVWKSRILKNRDIYHHQGTPLTLTAKEA
jgi:hypothetical protein